MRKIAFIGFGEAATAIAGGWGKDIAGSIAAFDIKTGSPDPAVASAKRDDYRSAGIEGSDTLQSALDGAALIFSTVTADQALVAARNAAECLPASVLYFDMNSCAPGSKRQAAECIEAAGGRYVDVAVMAPVHPERHRVPLLVSGPHAQEGIAALDGLLMRPTLAEGPVGTASTIKMVRSIMVKGIEAVVAECVLSAVHAGIDETVLESLAKTFPGFDWPERAAYMLERVMVHGRRRAEEMREVARTVDELGLEGRMARAGAEWQETVGALELNQLSETEKADYRLLARKILEKIG
jgi:3-hydroxyisobutyrate dehydrogenase-like beta-hydroxyacid dehydrogenase